MLFNCYLKKGELKKAENIISEYEVHLENNHETAKELLNKYKKIQNLRNEKDTTSFKSGLEDFLKFEGYSFLTAMLYGNIFEKIGDYKSTYQHLKKQFISILLMRNCIKKLKKLL